MKEEDFIFNDEPLCNEDDLIDYNKRLKNYNWSRIQSANYAWHGKKYAMYEPYHQDPDELLDCLCTLRELEEQGVRALTKLLDADPAYSLGDNDRSGESNTTNYDCIKWESAKVREEAERKDIERGIRRIGGKFNGS
tara:strand:+ start:148 stop:558 length:411 start_codon:yes stop_codon:yes gene_type:complete